MLCVRSLSPPIDEYIGRPPAVHGTGAKESDEPDKSSVRYDVHLDLDPSNLAWKDSKLSSPCS
jgi:hypothetical protein